MIHLIKSTFFNEEKTKKNLCAFIRRSKKLSMGEQCLGFEKAFARYQGQRFCTLYNSGSSANLALIQALFNLGHLKKNDKVAFSAVTWATNTMPLIQLGCNPVPVDVELDTLNVSSRTLLETLKKEPKIRALFLTHLLGFCSDLDEIKKICKQKNILLLEDNCESLGTVYQGRKLGTFGAASSFSFFVGHHMSTIEGGALCTDSEELATMFKMVRAHGWDRDIAPALQKRLRTKNKVNVLSAPYKFYELGYNLRPTEITGFLGLQQLKYIEKILKARNQNFLQWTSVMGKNRNFYPLNLKHIDFISNFGFPVIARSKDILDQTVARFQKADVEIRPIVGGAIPLQPFYKKRLHQHPLLPNATKIQNQGFYFGNNPELTRAEIEVLKGLLVE